jgi:hypothetical protein
MPAVIIMCECGDPIEHTDEDTYCDGCLDTMNRSEYENLMFADSYESEDPLVRQY